ncbi:glutaredoxin-like domain protein [Pyrolobus fumarii 1A]|uniref:Glutaredoxin-like domain protein n=1 Tax=Pyrolobus fumarii (strain DSM 11204 / 1A) TaxID=694429 RepID=G0EEK3_PYRF1|nr:thioredoxin family protein [Pyrolobus fumarii]AEM38825.1 glutaredoxin-like domain protein [Pyrolobus fumarii 1A]
MKPVEVKFTSEDREALREALSDMENPVDIHVFIGPDCEYCNEAVELVKILVEESPEKNGQKLLRMHVWEKGKHDNVFKEHGVERIPSITLLDGVIRYTGVPAGEEVRGLVETIIRISTNDSGLDSSTVERIKRINKPVHIEVVVTPQCPYCPYAALLANMFAFEAWKAGRRDFIADTVEAYENPDIAEKYGVTTVPAIAINGVLAFVGVPYEEDFIDRIERIVLRREKVDTEVIGESATGL